MKQRRKGEKQEGMDIMKYARKRARFSQTFEHTKVLARIVTRSSCITIAQLSFHRHPSLS